MRSQRSHTVARAPLTVACALVLTLTGGNVAAEGTFFKSRTASAPAQGAPQSADTSPHTPSSTQPPGTSQPDAPPPTAPSTPEEAPTESAAESISGPIERVVTTATFVVAGQQLELYGVVGESAPYVDALSGWLNANGNRLDCTPQGGKYRCFTPGKVDVGGVVIFNGAGKAAPDAPPEYVAAEQNAQAQRKGVWH